MRFTALLFVTLSLMAVGCRDSDHQMGDAPTVSLKTYAGETYTVSPRDQVVTLLVFWATWCGPCLMEIPTLVELHKKYSDRKFRVVAINVDDSVGTKAKAIMERFGITYPVLIGTDQTSHDYGGIQAIPTSFLIGRDGKLKEKIQGLESPEKLERLVVAEL